MKNIFFRRIFKGFLIFAALITIYLIGWVAFSDNKAGCEEHADDDILTFFIKKPEQLEFMNSRVGTGQLVLEANYRVSGIDAHLIEDVLRKESGMNELKFVCCGWESDPDGRLEITDKFNNEYEKLSDYNHISISMYSQETLIQDRKEWHKIPYFYVVVEVLNI